MEESEVISYIERDVTQPMPPCLPSVLPSKRALQDGTVQRLVLLLQKTDLSPHLVTTTLHQLEAALNLGKVTSPEQSVTPPPGFVLSSPYYSLPVTELPSLSVALTVCS